MTIAHLLHEYVCYSVYEFCSVYISTSLLMVRLNLPLIFHLLYLFLFFTFYYHFIIYLSVVIKTIVIVKIKKYVLIVHSLSGSSICAGCFFASTVNASDIAALVSV